MLLSNVTGIQPAAKLKPTNQLVLPDCFLGIEVEVEGRGCINIRDSHQYWDIKQDGSLRNDGLEAVFKAPTAGEDVILALDELVNNVIQEDRAQYNERTSVHVHLDVRDISVEQLFTFLFFYLYCEKAIYNYVGHNREESNYCIPWWKTEQLKASLISIYRALQNEDTSQVQQLLHHKMSKYSGLNLKSINQFGTVEFRHHYGTHNKARLLEWINIIQSLKQQAMTVNHSHVSFEELISEHFTIPEDLDLYMTEETTYKGLSYLNEIYHECRLYDAQRVETHKLRQEHLTQDSNNLESLQILDNFNRRRDLPTLRPRRINSGDIDEEAVYLFTGGSVRRDEEEVGDVRPTFATLSAIDRGVATVTHTYTNQTHI